MIETFFDDSDFTLSKSNLEFKKNEKGYWINDVHLDNFEDALEEAKITNVIEVASLRTFCYPQANVTELARDAFWINRSGLRLRQYLCIHEKLNLEPEGKYGQDLFGFNPFNLDSWEEVELAAKLKVTQDQLPLDKESAKSEGLSLKEFYEQAIAGGVLEAFNEDILRRDTLYRFYSIQN